MALVIHFTQSETSVMRDIDRIINHPLQTQQPSTRRNAHLQFAVIATDDTYTTSINDDVVIHWRCFLFSFVFFLFLLLFLECTIYRQA